MNNHFLLRIDWLSFFLYLVLVSFGIVNIYSTGFADETLSLVEWTTPAGKQFWIFIFSLLLFPFVLFINSSFFEHLSYVFYGISILSLLGLFLFGQKISGATSWYLIGGFSLQPSEFAKISTALVLTTRLSSIQMDFKKRGDVLKLFLVIGLPIILILLQPDAGSALVFLSLFFVLFREGLDLRIFYLALALVTIFILTLVFKPLNLSIALVVLIFLAFQFIKRNNSRIKKTPFLLIFLALVFFSFSVNFIFNNVFEQRHRDRFNIVLGLETDTQGIGYNINQSKIAIGSGGFSGKGFLNGTQTKGGFVPAQHTDYIFTTIGEEWGFLGSSGLIILFTVLIFRILYRAEKHTQPFPRIFSYCFASIVFIHFFVNIGMTLGLVPTVGIPLPFISYGGTSLLAFSLMLFIYLNLDANRLS
jgi:rod shape determining protein RodA